MELFDENGCLTDEGLRALQAGQLDERSRLKAVEHLACCDRCTDRYTALLTADVLEEPPRSARRAGTAAIWVRLMQNTWGRASVAAGAAVLALTMWRSGTIEQLLCFRQQLHSWVPETSQSQAAEPEQLGRPVKDKRQPVQTGQLGQPIEDTEPESRVSLAEVLNGLLFGRRDTTKRNDLMK